MGSSEGWLENDYLILFGKEEVATISAAYGIADFLPGYRIIGMRSWDDFILENSKGANFIVPTVPLTNIHIHPVEFDLEQPLKSDTRFIGRIKWYLKPLIFGGSAEAFANLTWVDSAQHILLVRWWNEKYREFESRD